jgi:(1->4)-alpha-D-glucan 1-alpha-D-glucosylmutase
VHRYVCIHGHFYQPPRENPWLEMVELQDSAYPYHDWNERITAECYAPNSVARVLDAGGRIERLVNNYSRISFNFGPTLFAWLEHNAADVYQRVLDADREGRDQFHGHGSALAQVYNHIIMPLATRADKETQIAWGIGDFRHRFGREPEGAWLAETAVDLATLEVLAEHGVRFTVLAPSQASRVRPVGAKQWSDVSGGRVDPSVSYVQRLASGRSIGLFFYDGPVSQAVAFEKLLTSGENLARRLVSAFSDDRKSAQLVHIATDGESYGHHHPHGDMALAYALDRIAATPGVALTNYGEFFEKHPPEWEVEIIENSSWSCVHGIERWRSNCGCNSGRQGWQQNWRGPLREALDGLRDAAGTLFERDASALLKAPWAARNDYIDVLLDRQTDNVDAFFTRHARRGLSPAERSRAIKLLEMQRHALLMYTSCGWFFDEISGTEAVQVLMYAGRVIQLAEDLCDAQLEPAFLEQLARAPSNLPHLHASGREVYEKYVAPTRLAWQNIAAHYAVASLFQSFAETSRIACYDVVQQDVQLHEAGKVKLVVGHARLDSEITLESWDFMYAGLHLGDHNVNAGVSAYPGDPTYAETAAELAEAFSRVDTPQALRLMDRRLGEAGYSIASLFRDLQRQVLKRLLRAGLTEITEMYQHEFDRNLPLMRFLKHLAAPIPMPLQATAQVLFNSDLRWALKDDDPDLEQIRRLVEEAQTWNVPLDSGTLGFQLTKMLDRLAVRWAGAPEQLEPLAALAASLDMARQLPFEPNLWAPQNTFFAVRGRAFDAMTERAAIDPAAAQWVEMFLAVGDKLGIIVDAEKKKAAERRARPGISSLVDELIETRHVPDATYRLQFNSSFTFPAARAIVPYLRDLGISDVYASPILQARPGSMHGYDICDHSRVSDELLGEAKLLELTQALESEEMGIVLDVVPNHMAVCNVSNPWWEDVLEHGASSRYSDYFDIDWNPTNPDLAGKVLLPILGDQYGRTLESGQLRLSYGGGSFVIRYFETALPVAPGAYVMILSPQVAELKQRLGDDHEHLLEYRSILTAIEHLPPQTALREQRRAERYREVAIIKRRLAALEESSAEVRSSIAGAVDRFNGAIGNPESFDDIDRLIAIQSYRPAFWRVAMDEINYRRFFDINELAAIRVEDPRVFEATHRVIFELLAKIKRPGLRIDHPDGLYTPARYFKDIQERFLLDRIQVRQGDEPLTRGAKSEALAALSDQAAAGRAAPLYVVAEKILGENELLPRDWMVDGTTGYEFLTVCNRLFLSETGVLALDRAYRDVIGEAREYEPLVRRCKHIIMRTTMASEINTLSHQLDRLAERNRNYRDFTLSNLRFALREFIGSMAIYRSYTTPDAKVSDRDRQFIELACEHAKALNQPASEDIFDFIRDTVLLQNLDQFPLGDRPSVLDWVLRFQQVTGPIMAKGIEDTAFYVYNKLVSLNDVGGHPDRCASTLEAFHEQNAERARNWPAAMLCSSTHDTKRSEDVRARINVLAELVEDWRQQVASWLDLTRSHVSQIDGMTAPTANDQYLLYQTLIGTWPGPAPSTAQELAAYRDRIMHYMEKAIKEAKEHTSWVNPNLDYDAAVARYVTGLLAELKDNPFLASFMPFAQRVALLGRFNSLAQVVLKLTSPGIPDIYQGNELWDFSLVDPDNRRPVDYAIRAKMLSAMLPMLDATHDGLDRTVAELFAHAVDGRIKMYVTARLLHYRRSHAELFKHGSYQGLAPVGAKADAVCAFARRFEQRVLIVAACIRPAGVSDGGRVAPIGAEAWANTVLPVPDLPAGAKLKEVLTGRELCASVQEGESRLSLCEMFGTLPIAVVETGL